MHHVSGSAAALHARPWPSPPVPSVWLLEADGPALVLGSTQRLPPVTGADGIAVVRRHSGGGAVLLQPGNVLWADVVVPVGDRRWTADVGRGFWWLGEAWVEALEAVGVTGAEWHRGPLVRGRWSRDVCFAGLGPGEVTLGGRKVVGMSARRRRDAALVQCAALLRWDPAAVVAALALPPEAEEELEGVAEGLDVPAGALQAAFLAALARR